MRVFKPKRRDENGVLVEYQHWYVEFWDHNRKMRRVPGLKEKKITEEIGRKIERLVALRMAGEKPDTPLVRWLEVAPPIVRDKLAEFDVIDSVYAASVKTLTQHVEDWRKALLAKGATDKHSREAKAMVVRLFNACGFKHLGDVKPGKVEAWLAEQRNLRENPMGPATSNHYLKCAKAFCNWMVRDSRMNSNPINYLQRVNAAVDVRRRRRALTEGEVGKLIAATEQGAFYRRISGKDRALLYRLALETGLRASEIRSLTRNSFDFKGNPPTVTVEAACSKRRRTDVLPMRRATAALVAAHTANKLPFERVFPTIPEKTSKMIKHDLTVAKIPYCDEFDCYADFHALRHTFITNLARSGVHPKVAQDLARHSTITLTMDRYTHTALETQVEALERLPRVEYVEAKVGAAV
jgi:integrase